MAVTRAGDPRRNAASQQPVRVLQVEDVAADAERALYQLRKAGLACEALRVETAPALIEALRKFSPAVILSDFSLPQFDGMAALRICREHAPQVPFVLLSGSIGEERAVEVLRAGAADYVLKESIARLAPAVLRALEDAKVRAERAAQQAQIERMNRVLRMIKGINDVVLRSRDRAELLQETCRLAVSLGRYGEAIAMARAAEAGAPKVLAAHGLSEPAAAALRARLEDAASREARLVEKMLASGEMTSGPVTVLPATQATVPAAKAVLRTCAVLPLMVDGQPSAALMLRMHSADALSREEQDLLRDLAHSLSLGLQYVHRDTRARFLANFHPQTGLARRALFCTRVHEMVSPVVEGAPGHAVAVMDIRSLGAINDAFGRHTGDRLLRQVADVLKRQFGQPERLAHFGGGTFALVSEKHGAVAHAWLAKVQQQVLEAFAHPVQVEDRQIPVALRLGCALHPEDADDATGLVQRAETALLSARTAGESFARFDSAVQKRAVGNLAMEHRLRFALERNQFELHYQPKVNVVTRRIQGAEALLRWRCPEQGLVSPAGFLPVLEASGLIVDVGKWVVQQAARDCRSWKEAGLPPVRVAVNIAPAHLRQADFESFFFGAVRSWASRTWGLDIEITEGMLHEDCDREVQKLTRLRAQGVRMAIDDFGTGYSSLSRLADMPVDTLKIDRRFISQIVRNPTGAAVVKTMVSLAHAFSMTSVAEGVEKQEELDQLWHLGCDQSQGYLHCVPLPAEEFATVLQHGRGVLIQPPAHEEDEPEDAPQAAATKAG